MSVSIRWDTRGAFLVACELISSAAFPVHELLVFELPQKTESWKHISQPLIPSARRGLHIAGVEYMHQNPKTFMSRQRVIVYGTKINLFS